MKQIYTFLKGLLAALLLGVPALSNAATIAKEDLVGDWALTYQTFNDDGDEIASDTTMTFTIFEKDGALKVTKIFGGNYEFDLEYSETGISIPFTNDVLGESTVLICGSYDGMSTPPVTFTFGDDNTLVLSSMIYGLNEFNNEGFIALSGTATKVAQGGGESTEPQALGNAITDITKLSNDKVYAIYNPIKAGSDTYTSKGAYVVYNPSATNPTYLWAANGEQGEFNSGSVDFSLTDENHGWMAIQYEGSLYIYNLGAKMFMTTYGYQDAGSASGPSKFSATATPISVETRTDGYLALTSHDGDDHSFLCAAPQFTSYPMSVWTSDDDGSAWVFKENPNLKADDSVIDLVTAIASVKTTAPAASKGVYSVSGVKMSTSDLTKLPKGIYIVNGQKQIVK